MTVADCHQLSVRRALVALLGLLMMSFDFVDLEDTAPLVLLRLALPLRCLVVTFRRRLTRDQDLPQQWQLRLTLALRVSRCQSRGEL